MFLERVFHDLYTYGTVWPFDLLATLNPKVSSSTHSYKPLKQPEDYQLEYSDYGDESTMNEFLTHNPPAVFIQDSSSN